MSSLAGLPPDQIDALEQAGQITPQVAASMRAAAVTGPEPEDEILSTAQFSDPPPASPATGPASILPPGLVDALEQVGQLSPEAALSLRGQGVETDEEVLSTAQLADVTPLPPRPGFPPPDPGPGMPTDPASEAMSTGQVQEVTGRGGGVPIPLPGQKKREKAPPAAPRAPPGPSLAGPAYAARKKGREAQEASLGGIEESTEQRKQAESELAEIKASSKAQELAQVETEIAQLEEDQSEQREKQRTAETGRKKYLDMLQSSIAELDQETKIDPYRYLGKEPATRVVAGIAMALSSAMGAYAATMGRTPNFAQQIIDKAIERDLQAQKTDAASSMRKSAAKRNLYTQLIDQYGGDEDAADNAFRYFGKEVASRRARQLALKNASQETIQQSKILQSQLDQDKAKLAANIMDKGADRELRAAQMIQQGRQAEAATGGPAGQARGKALTAGAVERRAEMKEGEDLILKLEKMFHGKKGDWLNTVKELFPGSKARNYADFRRMISIKIAKAMSGVAVRPEERERIEALIPTNLTLDANAVNMIQNLKQMLAQKLYRYDEGLVGAGYHVPKFSEPGEAQGTGEESVVEYD